jgi:hypothetical protein
MGALTRAEEGKRKYAECRTALATMVFTQSDIDL